MYDKAPVTNDRVGKKLKILWLKFLIITPKPSYICNAFKESNIPKNDAEVAQLVEHDLAKVGVASSSLVSRSR